MTCRDSWDLVREDTCLAYLIIQYLLNAFYFMHGPLQRDMQPRGSPFVHRALTATGDMLCLMSSRNQIEVNYDLNF